MKIATERGYSAASIWQAFYPVQQHLLGRWGRQNVSYRVGKSICLEGFRQPSPASLQKTLLRDCYHHSYINKPCGDHLLKILLKIWNTINANGRQNIEIKKDFNATFSAIERLLQSKIPPDWVFWKLRVIASKASLAPKLIWMVWLSWSSALNPGNHWFNRKTASGRLRTTCILG